MKNLIFIFSFVISFQLTTIFAQDKTETVNTLVNTLKQKVLLNDDQTSSIQRVLNELITKSKSADNKDDLVKDAQNKVESYLDKRQKLKYDIIKNDWWKQVQAIL
ncbi:hypothetical protein [Ignavibacterium album]|uniref:hypothetical protein n=1 Tax=Ignavibacterium album TaxID=591197 RepID=UPI0035BA936C